MELKENIWGIQHIDITTESIEETVAFHNGLGFETALRTEVASTGKKVAFLRLKNLTVEAYETNSVSGFSGAIDHLALDVLDIEAAFQTAREKNYQIKEKKIQFLPFYENGVRYFNIEGPNFETIEFC